jgi:hypothetical protein
MRSPVRVIGIQASHLASRLGVWRRIEQARDAAAMTTLDLASAFQLRKDVDLLAGALGNVLGLHEPRDGSPYCPGCSTNRERRGWPCPTWDAASRELLGNTA